MKIKDLNTSNQPGIASLSKEAFSDRSSLKEITSIAVGALAFAAGIGLLLAAFHHFPYHINLIDTWNLESKIVGGIIAGIGLIFVTYGIYHRYSRKESPKSPEPSNQSNPLDEEGGKSIPSSPQERVVNVNVQEEKIAISECLHCHKKQQISEGQLQKDVCEPCDFQSQREQVLKEIAQVYEELAEFATIFSPLSNAQKMVIALFYMNWQRVDINEDELKFGENKKASFQESFCATFRGDYDSNECATQIRKVIRQNRLDVHASEEEILEAYIKYNRLILLRPLRSEVLLLGCGWGECRNDSKSSYAHSEVDTVNILLSMNPSVLCFWGEESQTGFFKDRYSIIYDEGPIIAFLKDKKAFWDSCATALKKTADHVSVVVASHIFESSSFKINSMLPPQSMYAQIHTPDYQIYNHTYSYDKRVYRLKSQSN